VEENVIPNPNCGVCPTPFGVLDTECLGEGLSQVNLLSVTPDNGTTTVAYSVCQCSNRRVTAVFFAICEEGETPVFNRTATRDANDPGLNPVVFEAGQGNNPLSTSAVRFNVSEELDDTPGECVTINLVFNGNFTAGDLTESGVGVRAVGNEIETGTILGVNCQPNGNGDDECDDEIIGCAVVELPSGFENISARPGSLRVDLSNTACCVVEDEVDCFAEVCGEPVFCGTRPTFGVRISGPIGYFFRFDADVDFCGEPDPGVFTAQGTICVNEIICLGINPLECPDDLCDALDNARVVAEPEIIECNGEIIAVFTLRLRFNCEAFAVTPPAAG
jgi:hypothetical protein